MEILEPFPSLLVADSMKCNLLIIPDNPNKSL